MLRKQSEIPLKTFTRCHEGSGDCHARLVLSKPDSQLGLLWMHDDTLPPGATIGEHRHDDNEELYYVLEGHGTMILDGQRSPIGAGDVSVVHPGHTHGIENSNDSAMRLLVVCVGRPKDSATSQ